MNRRTLIVALTAVTFGALAAALRLHSNSLRERLATESPRIAVAAQLRADNERTKATLARAKQSAEAGGAALRAEVERARSELAALEAKARQAWLDRKRNQERSEQALADNRDPRSGLVRIEHFQEQGRGSPSAAFQSLVVAAFKGDEPALLRTVGLSADARAKAEELIAGLPEEGRAKWTPEKLALLFCTGFFGEVTAAQIVSEKGDGDRATLSIRVSNGTRENTIPMELERGPDGWRAVLSSRHIDSIRRRMAARPVAGR